MAEPRPSLHGRYKRPRPHVLLGKTTNTKSGRAIETEETRKQCKAADIYASNKRTYATDRASCIINELAFIFLRAGGNRKKKKMVLYILLAREKNPALFLSISLRQQKAMRTNGLGAQCHCCCYIRTPVRKLLRTEKSTRMKCVSGAGTTIS